MTESQTATPAPQKSPVGESKQSKPANRRPFVIIALVLFVAISGYFLWKHFFSAPDMPKSIVALSGRIEGDDSAVAAKTSGRIAEMRVREGDQVKAGDVIAIIDDEQIRAREQQAQSAVDQAQ